MAAARPKMPPTNIPQGLHPNFPSIHQPSKMNNPTVAAKTAPRFKYPQEFFSRFSSFFGSFSVAGPSGLAAENDGSGACVLQPVSLCQT